MTAEADRRPDYAPYLDGGDGPFRWRLGLRPLDLADWIQIDEHFAAELAAKRTVLADHHDTVFAALPDVRATAGCADVLDELVDHLVSTFPEHFAAEGSAVRNLVTGEAVERDGDLHPLDIAGRLVQEDLAVMTARDDDPDGPLVFAAGSVCFPNRWDLQSKIGLPIDAVHAPVDELNTQLAGPIAKFFDRLGTDRSFWRLGWGVLDTDDLYQPLDGTAGPRPTRPVLDDLIVRVERETLRRFPRTGAVLFTIRTYTTPLTALLTDRRRLDRLTAQIDSMPPGIARYKQIDVIRPALAELFD